MRPCLHCDLSLIKTIPTIVIVLAKKINRDDSYSGPGSSSPPLTDETEFPPLTGKLILKDAHTGFETHKQQFVKDRLGKLYVLLQAS